MGAAKVHWIKDYAPNRGLSRSACGKEGYESFVRGEFDTAAEGAFDGVHTDQSKVTCGRCLKFLAKGQSHD